MEQGFIGQITQIMHTHISDERFGVSELAREAGMSRSNLLRKIKSQTGLSASRFISQLRLEYAMELLQEQELNVTEAAYASGFNSTSYFTRCFHEHFGYPPGEVAKRKLAGKSPTDEAERTPAGETSAEKAAGGKGRVLLGVASLGAVLAVALILILLNPFRKRDQRLEKSIAVLPFRNESPDSSNEYLVNGLMESLLGDLQKIADLKVISRTSVEKFRKQYSSAPEIGRELNVNYLVTGSGQKQGDEILLNIQLIEAPGDRQLWSGRYLRAYENIFQLQIEVAGDIAAKIEAIITPQEKLLLEKVPTSNLAAYDLFMKGLEEFRSGSTEALNNSIVLFQEAIAEDPGYADSHALLAIAYSVLDIYTVHRQYSDEIRLHAGKALELDPQSARALVANALYHMSVEEYDKTLPYLEKALEYNPNSSMVINILSDYYTHVKPDTELYLEYALKGLRLDLAAHDSAEASVLLLHVGNAFAQSGFIKEAEEYILRSLSYDPDNLYAESLQAYILYARDRDLEDCRNRLLATLQKDSMHFEILKELGNISYFMRDFGPALRYYAAYFNILQTFELEIPRGEYGKYSLILRENGQTEAADQYLREYLDQAMEDQSKYKHLSLSAYYAQTGDTLKALEEMRLFSRQEKYPYWYVLFLENDPLFGDLYAQPEFQSLLKIIRLRFWNYHNELKATLEEKGVL